MKELIQLKSYRIVALIFIGLLCLVLSSCGENPTIQEDLPENLFINLKLNEIEIETRSQLLRYDKTVIVVVYLKYSLEGLEEDKDFYGKQNNFYAKQLGINLKANFLISSTDQSVWYSYTKMNQTALNELLKFLSYSFVDYILLEEDDA